MEDTKQAAITDDETSRAATPPSSNSGDVDQNEQSGVRTSEPENDKRSDVVSGGNDSEDDSDDEKVVRTIDYNQAEDDDSDDDDSEDGKAVSRLKYAKSDSDEDESDKDNVKEDDDKDEDVPTDKGVGKNKRKANDKEDEDDEDESSDDDVDEDDGGEQEDKEESKGEDEEDEDEDEDDEKGRAEPSNSMIYDFDIMMAKKKEENSRRRRQRGYDVINDNDDIIASIINQMRDAVEADIEANKNRKAATKKLGLLPFVMNQLRKIDLRDAFLDSDVLGVLTEWLAPLPDKSLPHLNIRENLLKILIGFNLQDVDRIKGSGIGKAVMYLYKHPKETKENKQRAKQLISSWSRPIFNLDSNFSAISREEREERDKELQRRARRNTESSDNEDSDLRQAKKMKEDTAPVANKPGDKGWIPRARVPAPSMKDYVIRPRSKVDGDVGKGSKRPTNMLEKLMKNHQERRRASKQQRAVTMKIDKI